MKDLGFTYGLNEVWIRHLKVSHRSSALGVNHTFGNPFAIKMGNVIQEGEILQDNRSIYSSCLTSCQGLYRSSIAGTSYIGLLEVLP